VHLTKPLQLQWDSYHQTPFCGFTPASHWGKPLVVLVQMLVPIVESKLILKLYKYFLSTNQKTVSNAEDVVCTVLHCHSATHTTWTELTDTCKVNHIFQQCFKHYRSLIKTYGKTNTNCHHYV